MRKQSEARRRAPHEHLRCSRRESILRRHRIEKLRQRVVRGEYRMSALDIAGAMLSDGVCSEMRAA
jgi:anti-sigma28 factor (negative regulator of flagellin synthesis)